MFEEYAVLPVDVPLPAVDIAEFRAFVQSTCESCAFTDNRIRMVTFEARKPVFNGRQFLHAADPRMRQTTEDTIFAWDPVFRARFPDLCDWFEALPFDELHGLTLVTQTDDVREHLDVFGHHNSVTYYEMFRDLEPMYYRVVFCEPDDVVSREQCFYVTLEYGGEKHFVKLPPTSTTMAMASSTCYHGAVHNPGHYKTTAALYGKLNPDRHYELLQRSIERYGDRAVTLAVPGPVSGPGAVLPYGGA